MSSTKANPDSEQRGSRHSKIPRFDLDHMVRSSRKRLFSSDGSREHPIIIDDSTESKTKIKASPQKRRRTNHYDPLEPARSTLSKFSEVNQLLRSSKKIVVISGAGISAKAGFPTFEDMRKSKQTLHRSLYSSVSETASFHSTISSMFETLQSDQCQPTSFHQIMDHLASENRLLRHITQNIDCLEQKSPDLNSKTLRLHGQIDQMRCEICHKVYPFQPKLFLRTDLPDCQQCIYRSQVRITNGRRSLPIGKLKPDVLLYGNSCSDDDIFDIINQDLATCPDLVLVVGTKLRVPGAREIATRLCKAARRAGGVAVWIGYDNPPSKSLFDHMIRGDCHEIMLSSLSEERT